MTVCVATLFMWNHAKRGDKPDYALAALTASDQMITYGDIQYEPAQQKVSYLNGNTIALIAGSYSVHTEALASLELHINNNPGLATPDIAAFYGKQFQNIKQREAEALYLAPLGLSLDSFLSRQSEMVGSFVEELRLQLQNYEGQEAEALIIGASTLGAQVYFVNSSGSINAMNDVGFKAIGNGAWHAESHLMQMSYKRTTVFADALFHIYSAKKRAEIAPGVGMRTDMHIVTRDGASPVNSDAILELEKQFRAFDEARTNLTADCIGSLQTFMDNYSPPSTGNLPLRAEANQDRD